MDEKNLISREQFLFENEKKWRTVIQQKMRFYNALIACGFAQCGSVDKNKIVGVEEYNFDLSRSDSD